MIEKWRELTPEELEALQEYAKEKGRYWKGELRTDWYYARRPGILQAIRNNFGPSWLLQFKLPEEKKKQNS